jgi:hypothetical protein
MFRLGSQPPTAFSLVLFSGLRLQDRRPRWDSEPKTLDLPAASPILEEARKLVHRDQRSKGAFGQFLVVRNGKPSIRRLGAPEDDVAPVLFVGFVPDFSKRLDRLG